MLWSEESLKLLKFEATWCIPCKTMTARFNDEKVKEALKKHKVKLTPIDVDTDVKAANNYKIEVVPTLILVSVNEKNEAKVLKRVSSTIEIKELIEFIEPPKEEPKKEEPKPEPKKD